MKMSIRRLSPTVVSSLRTDVTVSSTSQCVSELVLNSIDAEATVVAVRVDLRNFKLQVVDNGHGITSTDLNALGSRYMTSKCHSLDDLSTNLINYGFRGEALCSIIEVSGTVRIVSRAKGCENSFCKVFSQGVALCVGKSSTPLASCGTSITIGDFLYNRPVRRTRIKPVLDLEEIKKHIESIALINPHVSFRLWDDVSNELMMQTFQTGDVRKTFGALFGEDLSQSLVPIEQSFASFTLKGYISRQAHPLKNFQYVYLNKRLLLRTKLHKLINSIMSRSAIMKTNNVPYVPISKEINHGVFLAFSPPKRDKHAVFIFNISCSHSEYDITQDPRKTLVEFNDWDGVLSCIEKGLRCFIEKESKGAEEEGVHDGLGVAKKDFSVIDEINNLDRECAFGFDSSVTTMGESGLEVVQGLPATRNVVDFSSKTASDVLLSSNIGLHSDTAFSCTKTSFLSNSVPTERPYLTSWRERSSHSMKSLDSPHSEALTDTGLSSFQTNTTQTKSNDAEFPKQLSVESLREGFANNRLYFEENFRRLTQTSKMFEEESKSEIAYSSVNAIASLKEKPRKNFLRNLEKFSYDVALKKPQLCNSNIVKGSNQDNPSVLKNRSRGCNTLAAHQTIICPGKTTTKHLNSSLATCKTKNLKFSKSTLARECSIIQSGWDSPNLEPFEIQGNRSLTKNNFSTSSLYVGCSEKENSDSGTNFEDLNLGTSMEVAFSEDLCSTSEFTCNNKGVDICTSGLICHPNTHALSSKNGPIDFEVACKETKDLTSKKMFCLPVLTQETLMEDISHETLEQEGSSSVTCNYVSNNRNIFCVDNFIKDLTVKLPDETGLNNVVINQTFNECLSVAHYTNSVCSGVSATSSFQDLHLSGSSKGGLCDESAFNLSRKNPQVRLVDYSSSSSSFSSECDALSCLPGEVIQKKIEGKREQNFQSSETHISKKVCISLPDLALQADDSIGTIPDKNIKNSHSDKSSESDTFGCINTAESSSENISKGNVELKILSASLNQQDLKCSENQEISVKQFCYPDPNEYTNDKRTEVHSGSSTCQDPFKETSQLQRNNHDELTSRLMSKQQETATDLNNKLTITACTDYSFGVDSGNSVSVVDALCITKVPDHESPALSQDNVSDENDWAEEKDSAGKPFYVHKKSGITVYNKPQADAVGTFTLNDRFSFLPKGMSPIVQEKACNKQFVEDDLSSEKRKELLSMASICCNSEELSTVKWKTQNSDCKDKSWPLLDQLMSDISGSSEKFVIESQVSSVAVQDLSQPDIQVYNVLYPYTFSKDIFKNLKVIGQLDKKFIVTVVNTDAEKQVLVLFDQHAVHERVRVENLTKEYQQHDGHAIWRSAPVEPALPLVLSSIEVRILSSYQEKMNQLGLHFDVLDSNTISIQRVPTCLLLRETREVQTRRTSVLRQHLESLIREEVDSLLNTRGVGTSHPTIISSVISSEACRGAIKFGDPLSLADCQALLHNLSSCCLPFQCAHGRPALVPILDVFKLKKPSSVSKPALQNLKKYLKS